MNHGASTLGWIDDELQQLERMGLRRQVITHAGPQGAVIRLKKQHLINWGSNDYLGLAADPRLAAAATTAIEQHGWGAGASPLITGHSSLHDELERRLADFEGTEAALLFPSGFAANVGTIEALVGRGDAVFSDDRNHASLIDGCRLSRADVHVYRHCDARDLESSLSKATTYRRKLIVTDTVFSMDGDVAPLEEICNLAERFGCMVMFDEAHATGVFGRHGSGLTEWLGLEERVHIRVGTLSKALGCAGGFVAGSKLLVDWLTNRARPYVFSTAHPAAGAAAALAALDVVQCEPGRREKLLQNAAYLRDRLTVQGWNCRSSQSQIVPVVIGGANETMSVSAELRKREHFVPGIRPPSVPEGESLLRISLSYGHTREMLDGLIDAMNELRR